MKKQNYRSLAYAVAIALGCTAMPGTSWAAEAPAASAEPAATAETAAQDAAAVAPAAAKAAETAAAPETKAAAETSALAQADAVATSTVDERTLNWGKTRPQETAIADSMKQYEGQTVVETVFDGTSALTEGTAKAAISMKAGDMFTVKGLEADRDKIYNTGYFYDIYPSFEKVPEGVVVTYHVLENPVLKGISLSGNTVENTETLQGLITMKTGEILNSRELSKDVMAIQEQYRRDGYILAKITDMNIDKNGILTLKVNEGILEGYKVKGNTKTKERVILREMRQKPGEPFNSKLARRSMQRVYNLGFFEDVNIKMNPGVDPNAVVMELDVTEKRTGSFGIGAGYSSEDGVVGMVSIGDTNFRGTGDAISLSYETSGDDTDAHGYTFSYRRPWLDSKETVGTFRIYNRTYEYDDYDESGDLKETYMRKYSGGELTFGRPVSEYSTNYLTLRNCKDSYVKHVDDGNLGDRSTPAYEGWRRDNFGTTRSVTFEHVTDTRDNVYNPMSGSRLSLSGEFAGFGGDFDFQKYTALHPCRPLPGLRAARPLWRRHGRHLGVQPVPHRRPGLAARLPRGSVPRRPRVPRHGRVPLPSRQEGAGCSVHGLGRRLGQRPDAGRPARECRCWHLADDANRTAALRLRLGRGRRTRPLQRRQHVLMDAQTRKWLERRDAS